MSWLATGTPIATPRPSDTSTRTGGTGRPSSAAASGMQERVLWGDYLALELLRLRKIDIELLTYVREEYLEKIANNTGGGAIAF